MSAKIPETITSVTSDSLTVSAYSYESYPEVTEDVAIAALGAQ